MPADLWLTSFEDRSSPRPGTDEVFFSRSDDQSEVRPEPVIEYLANDPVIALTDLVILLPILLVGFVLAVAVKDVRRRRSVRAG